jgi:hypothetical protein
MGKYAKKVVAQARSWFGYSEANGKHKQIIDIYNAHKPLARGYAVKYTDPWCATFVSAVAIKLGYTGIIPTECSCTKMIELFKKLGAWVEQDNYTPKPGDIVFYDWEDSGRGDNQGSPDHVGIVETVNRDTLCVIEGNFNNAVGRRTMPVNGKYIRGYGVPKYDVETVIETTTAPAKTVTIELNQLQKGSEGEQVKTLQRLIIAKGYKLAQYGADGDFGAETEGAVRQFQSDNKLGVDGIVGQNTWNKLLKG